MKVVATVAAIVVLCAHADTARAQPGDGAEPTADAATRADALVEEGNALGAKGNYEGALQKWRDADHLVRRPLHACNIGLAYVRLAAMRATYWAQAHYYLSRCQSTWSEGSKPTWVEKRTAESLEELTRGNFAKVSVSVNPADAEWTISFLENDKEVFRGRRDFWVPVGQHVVIANHSEYESGTLTIVAENTLPQAVVLTLDKPEPAAPALPPPKTQPVASTTLADPPVPGKVWLYAGIGTGAAAVGLGVVSLVFRSNASSDAARIGDPNSSIYQPPADRAEAYQDGKESLDSNNAKFVGTMIGAAAIAGVSGYFFYKWASADDGEEPDVAIVPGPSGAHAVARWEF